MKRISQKWEKIIELQTLIEWIGPDKSQETKTEITPTCKASYLFILVLKDSYYIWQSPLVLW